MAAGEGRQAASNGKSQQFALRRHRSGPELHAATFNASAIAAAPSDGAHAPPSAAPHSQHLPASQATPRERRRLRVGHPGRTQSEQALSLGNPARDGDWGHTLEAHVPWRAFPPRGTSPVRSPSSGRDWKQERRIQRRARRVPSYSCLKEPVSPPSLAGSAPSATFAHPTVPGLAPSPRPTIPGLVPAPVHAGFSGDRFFAESPFKRSNQAPFGGAYPAGGKSTFTLADTRQPAKQGDYARTHMPAHPDFEVDVPESEA